MGRIERAKEGLFHGGGFIPHGYDYIDGKLVINDYEAIQIKEIYDLYLKGYGVSRIAYEMHEKYKNKYSSWHNHSAVSNVLDSPVYIGKIVFHNQVYDGQHEAIISEELYEKVQKLRKIRHVKKEKAFQITSLLGGFLMCGNCGARYFTKQNINRVRYYHCYSRAKNKKYMIKDPNCKNKTWRMDVLDEAVEAEILRLAVNRKHLDRIIAKAHKKEGNTINENKIINKKVKEIDKQISKLMDLYQFDTIPAEELGKRIEKLYLEKKDLQGRLKTVEDENPIVQKDDVLKLLEDLEVVWKYAGLEEKRKILGGLVNRIIVKDNDIKIEWSFI